MSDANDLTIDRFFAQATFETLGSFTIGVAANDNTQIGTGTLVSFDGQKFILTAKHVIQNAKVEELRFWLRPPAPIIEKAVRDTTAKERGATTPGIALPIEYVAQNDVLDIAILRLKADTQLPDGPRFYDLSESSPFSSWDEAKLDGLSLHVFGFPAENSVVLRRVGNHIENFVGTAFFSSRYLRDRNESHSWSGLEFVSPNKDFLFDYPERAGDNYLAPPGLSGAGVWVQSDGPDAIWTSRPMLLGVCHRYFERFGLLAATKVSVLLSGFGQATPPK